MRRKERDITDPGAIAAVIEACDCCRLGLWDGEEVYIVPMNFGYAFEEGRLTLYFHCAKEGRKLELLRANPRAGFEMDTGHALIEGDTACRHGYAYRSVIGQGSVRIVEEPALKAEALRRLMAHYTHREDWHLAPAQTEGVAVLALEAGQYTCKGC